MHQAIIQMQTKMQTTMQAEMQTTTQAKMLTTMQAKMLTTTHTTTQTTILAKTHLVKMPAVQTTDTRKYKRIAENVQSFFV